MTQQPLEDLLAAVTDALLADEKDLAPIIARHDVSRNDVEPLVSLIRRLHQFLVGVQPSQRFVARLKSDLIGTHESGLVARVRYLPPRVQMAAGVVAIAGFMLLARRRLVDLAVTKDDAEVIVTQ